MGAKSAVINLALELEGVIESPIFIGSRGAGEIIRNKMDTFFDEGVESITLEFLGVEEITQSFGDEIIGIYVRAFGVNFVKSKIKLNNANQSIKDTLNFVASYSKVKTA
ncbi:MAG: STAS-like domain-containing protein [Campylobacterales bacterium]|nr:STAS-like domain-containing protein [Campylobacterales bacterium]